MCRITSRIHNSIRRISFQRACAYLTFFKNKNFLKQVFSICPRVFFIYFSLYFSKHYYFLKTSFLNVLYINITKFLCPSFGIKMLSLFICLNPIHLNIHFSCKSIKRLNYFCKCGHFCKYGFWVNKSLQRTDRYCLREVR